MVCVLMLSNAMYAVDEKMAAVLSGMIAGAIEPFVGGQPLTTWKNYRQLGKPLTGLAPLEFWRGASVASCSLGINTGLQAGLHACLMPYVHSSFLASLAAGAGSAYIINGPAEIIVAQQQLHKKDLMPTIRAIYRQAGVIGYWRGCNWVAGREAGFSAGYLYLAPQCATHFKKHGVPEPVANVAGGVCGGLVAMIATHPCDLIKTKMAADLPTGYGKAVCYRSGFGVLKNTDPAALFNGCVPRLLNGTFAITCFALLAPFIQKTLITYKG